MSNLLEFMDTEEKDSYKLSDLASNEWKNFALYTVESRAIPNMIDGLKPSMRFYLYSSIKNSPKDFRKVESIAGVVTDYGYNHGTTSVANTGQLMAAEWNNNICLVEGRGSFGTRLVQQAAAARYTQTRLHPNFGKYVKDLNLSPKHKDPEHIPPAFYLPIIPLVLVNGVKGIATGFATSILPRSPSELIKACKEYVSTGKITNVPSVQFPQFSGVTKYNQDENRYYSYGVFERKGKTGLLIKEIPYGYDRETYIEILDKLEDDDAIVGYDDLCDDNGFGFDVKLKQNGSSSWTDEQIIKEFKLVKVYTENLTVIDQNGKLKEYSEIVPMIKDFCDYRFGILQQRIDLEKNTLSEEARWLKVKSEFVQAILDGTIIFKNKKKAEISTNILKMTSAIETDCDRLLRMNIMSLTQEMVDDLLEQIKEINKQLAYWSKTTPKEQFTNDLNEIK